MFCRGGFQRKFVDKDIHDEQFHYGSNEEVLLDREESSNDNDLGTQIIQGIPNLELEDKKQEAFVDDKTTHYEAINPLDMSLTKRKRLISIFQHFII